MYHVSRFLYSHLSFSESCIPDRLRIQKHLRLYVWWKREGQRRRRWGKLRQSNPAAARLDTDDGEDRGGQQMQAHRDYMKQQVSSAPSNQPQNQKTLINQNIPGGKRKEQGSARGKETASEDDDDSAADIESDGGQDVPLPAKRTRRIAPGNEQMESDSNSHEVFKGRQTIGETPQAALLRQTNAVEDPLEMAKEYVALTK